MKPIKSKDGIDRSATVKKDAIKDLNAKSKIAVAPKMNDGMNTPVPDKVEIVASPESEKALMKQAENPLGDPNKM